ncbi:kinase-like domain-containing protein, partial [Baffinella frigidus]
EAWSVKTERVRRMSRFGGHPGWGLSAVIVKAGDDLRQEQFAMLLLGRIKEVWDAQGLGLHLRTYSILATSPSSGLIEMVPDSVSLSSLRKKLPGFTTLAEFYRQAFGGAGSATFMAAQDNFMRSTAAYSVCCYVLKLKDRHDGNILIQRDGSVVHVDFGFMLGRHMNEVLTVERAPFKLTRDYVDLMGGEHSACFLQYIALCIQGLKVLRNHSAELLSICKAMAVGSPLACVSTPRELLDLEERLCLHKTDKEMVDTFVSLQSQALRSWSTTAYDRLQKLLGVY